MTDAVDDYLSASAANDIDALMHTLSPDAELVSPLSSHLVFRGVHDLRITMSLIYGTLHDMQWQAHVGDGEVHVATGSARVGRVTRTEATVFELAADGRIRRIRPHLRPWLALTVDALVIGPRFVRHPGVVLRALHRST
jgi:ketosteroid isomerase-like protein